MFGVSRRASPAAPLIEPAVAGCRRRRCRHRARGPPSSAGSGSCLLYAASGESLSAMRPASPLRRCGNPGGRRAARRQPEQHQRARPGQQVGRRRWPAGRRAGRPPAAPARRRLAGRGGRRGAGGRCAARAATARRSAGRSPAARRRPGRACRRTRRKARRCRRPPSRCSRRGGGPWRSPGRSCRSGRSCPVCTASAVATAGVKRACWRCCSRGRSWWRPPRDAPAVVARRLAVVVRQADVGLRARRSPTRPSSPTRDPRPDRRTAAVVDA